MSEPLAFLEVGGSGEQALALDDDGTPHVLDPDEVRRGWRVALAVPGLAHGDGTVSASNLGWRRVDPGRALGLAAPPELVLNDAVAAGLGELALRPGTGGPLVYLGVGTGVGGAVVDAGGPVAVELFGHAPGHGARPCRCGATGCLETVAGGWALPEHLTSRDLDLVADHLARAVLAEPAAPLGPLVVTGGVADAHPGLVVRLRALLVGRTVEPSARPALAKSAAAWGLRLALAGRLGRLQPDAGRWTGAQAPSTSGSVITVPPSSADR